MAVTLINGDEYEGPKESEEEKSRPKQGEAPVKIDQGTESPIKVKSDQPKYVPPLRFVPFPQRLIKHKLDEQNPKVEVDSVILNEECSTVLLNGLPPKLKDPGSFSIPCSIGKTEFKQAICDLGASVSLMSKAVYEKLGYNNLKPTKMSLTLADRSIRFPMGILEDVIIKIGNLKVPADFVVIEMEGDAQTSLLLGRPFLATAGAKIDVKNGKITFSIGEKNEEFHFDKPHNSSNENSSCMVEIQQVKDEGLKMKSVGTSETDEMNKFEKGDQVWFTKEKLMNLVARIKLKCKKKIKTCWSAPFKITKTYPTGGMEVWSAKIGSFKVKKKFAKHFLPNKLEKAKHGEALSTDQASN